MVILITELYKHLCEAISSIRHITWQASAIGHSFKSFSH